MESLKFSDELLNTLGLAEPGEAINIHSVLMQQQTEFTIYLPPHRVESSST